ncbi:MAG TPA: hypothetical protein ENK57_17515 [Polyangiaceae bacterium]|nr:hypothetical protein [Polyangiaceae bacterium]
MIVTAAALAAVKPLTPGVDLSTARAPAARGPEPDAQLVRASQQFEEVFVRQILESTNLAKSVGNGYGDMVVDAFAQAVTSGDGLGFGDQIARMLARAHHQGGGGTTVAAPLGAPTEGDP